MLPSKQRFLIPSSLRDSHSSSRGPVTLIKVFIVLRYFALIGPNGGFSFDPAETREI